MNPYDDIGSELMVTKTAFYLDIFAINQHVPPGVEDPPRSPDQVCKSSSLEVKFETYAKITEHNARNPNP
jgi:hypothetical protein